MGSSSRMKIHAERPAYIVQYAKMIAVLLLKRQKTLYWVLFKEKFCDHMLSNLMSVLVLSCPKAKCLTCLD